MFVKVGWPVKKYLRIGAVDQAVVVLQLPKSRHVNPARVQASLLVVQNS